MNQITSPAVSLIGYFTSPTGVGEAARRQFRALQAIGYPAEAYNIGLRDKRPIPFEGLTARLPDRAAAIFHINAGELIHMPGVPVVDRRQTRAIGFWHWELPVFPAAFVPAIEKVDEIWVPTQFGAEALYDVTRKPVRIVTHAVPLNDIEPEAARAAFGLPAGRLHFLTMLDTASYVERKNPAAVIRAFLDAFPPGHEDRPVLVVKMHGGNQPPAFREVLKAAEADPAIRIIDETLDDEGVRQLQAACDCLVSLHRSEGFGFNIAECMAAGKPVIATDFSGNRDFATGENSLPIPFAMRALAPGEYPWGRGQWWADPIHEAAVEAMRWVAGNAEAAAALGRRAKEDIRTLHSFERVGGLVAEALAASGIRPEGAKSGSAAPAAQFKAGRNDPCPCGSGRKFKQCHGAA